jgi:hypothetical protein
MKIDPAKIKAGDSVKQAADVEWLYNADDRSEATKDDPYSPRLEMARRNWRPVCDRRFVLWG